MSIAIYTGAVGGITTYSELVSAVRDMADDDNYNEPSILRSIRLAEAFFNRELRTLEMEGRATVSVDGNTAPLPLDFLQMRSLTNDSDAALMQMSPVELRKIYGSKTGEIEAYAIENNDLFFGFSGTGTFKMLYWSMIPALSENNQTNWLLTKHPDLYLFSVLYWVHYRERDMEGMNMASDAINAILPTLIRASVDNRTGGASMEVVLA